MNNLNYGIDKGHCLSGADTGAQGVKSEEILTREVGNLVVLKLKNLGYTVIDCTIDKANSINESLVYRVKKANSNNVSFYVSIHFNSGGGHGVEVWIGSESSRMVGSRVAAYIALLGFTNRGVKVQGIDGHHLYVLSNTLMPSILVECAFVDSVDDMNRYNAEDLSNAIVKGLTGNSFTQTGWYKGNGTWYYYSNGIMAKNTWAKDSSNRWFYLGITGAMVTNGWGKDSSQRWFYLGPDGAMVTNSWAEDSHGWCYLGLDGAWDGITHTNKEI